MAAVADGRSERGARVVVHDDCYAGADEREIERRIGLMHEAVRRILESLARDGREGPDGAPAGP